MDGSLMESDPAPSWTLQMVVAALLEVMPSLKADMFKQFSPSDRVPFGAVPRDTKTTMARNLAR